MKYELVISIPNRYMPGTYDLFLRYGYLYVPDLIIVPLLCENTWSEGLGFVATESQGPYISQGVGDHDQMILEQAYWLIFSQSYSQKYLFDESNCAIYGSLHGC